MPPSVTTEARLGALLRAGRLAKDLTQKEVGHAVGTNQSSVSAWESGTVQPRLRAFLKCCRVLELDPHALIDAAEDDLSDELAALRVPQPA